MSEETAPPSSMEARIRSWLRADSIVEPLPLLNARMKWALRATVSGKRLPIAIFEMADESECITIYAEAGMNQFQRTKFDKISDKERFMLNLQSILLPHEVDFDFDFDAYKLVVTERVYFDAFTRDAFWHRMVRVRCVALEALAFFHEKLGGPPLHPGSRTN